jgi:hypothetical protein
MRPSSSSPSSRQHHDVILPDLANTTEGHGEGKEEEEKKGAAPGCMSMIPSAVPTAESIRFVSPVVRHGSGNSNQDLLPAAAAGEAGAGTLLTMVVDPAPFQVTHLTPLSTVHYLFAICLIPQAFVLEHGRLIGILTKNMLLTNSSCHLSR